VRSWCCASGASDPAPYSPPLAGSALAGRRMRCGRSTPVPAAVRGLRATVLLHRRKQAKGRRARATPRLLEPRQRPRRRALLRQETRRRLLEAMFVASLRSLLDEGSDEAEMTIVPDPTSIFDLSREREQLRDAASDDDGAAFRAAFESLLVRIGPQAAAWDEAGHSRRRTRQLESVKRFEAWAEAEACGRTEASRAEAPRLGRLLHTCSPRRRCSLTRRESRSRSSTEPCRAGDRSACRPDRIWGTASFSSDGACFGRCSPWQP
jgi:hypothetical protein